jgi:hypothetical protein
MSKLGFLFKKVCSRLKLAFLVLKGIVPSRVNPGGTIHALQVELASARAEICRLAAALTDASLGPKEAAEELLEARSEITRINAELAALRTDAAGRSNA